MSFPPRIIGNCLIREHRIGFGEGHSASFGFTGAVFADFGYFSLLVVFLLGIGLRKLDVFRNNVLLQQGNYKKILAAMLFPYVFFFVRSPLTATITLFGIFVIYFTLKRLLFRITFN